MRLSRSRGLALAAVVVVACGGGTEASAPPPIDAPSRDGAPGSGTPSLSVSVEGGGSGTVTSSPEGIACPGACTKTFADETSVTLTATPSADSVFTGWSGGVCSGLSNVCTASVGGPVTVSARFAKKTNAVSVAKSGTGFGTVSSAPSGIDCGATCAAGFPAGWTVALTATPETGSTFAGWSGGGCAGTDAVCQLTIPAATEVSTTDVVATFTRETHRLTVNKAGGGTGTVVSVSGYIDCGATCAANIDFGTMVSLTATAGMGSTFTGWSGACTGTAACNVTMTTARNVTATFTTNGGGALTCSTVANAASCTNAQIAEINLGGLNGTMCHDQCQTKLAEAGVATGCWVVAINGNCYCRGGVLNLGGSSPGGSCN